MVDRMTEIDRFENSALFKAYEKRRFGEAIAIAAGLLAADPHQPAVLNLLGACLQSLEDFDGALSVYELCLSMKPDFLEALNNKGNVLKDLQRNQEAIQCFKRALVLDPSFSLAAYNWGNTLKEMGDDSGALSLFSKALLLNPRFSSAGWNMALIYLRHGHYELGWALYEHGWGAGQRGHQRDLNAPLWLGESVLTAKTLLVHWEQGFGDIIQFSRYVPVLWALGIRVVFWVPPALEKLMLSLIGYQSVITSPEQLTDFDAHCPLLSLPHALRHGYPAGACRIPYLHAEPGRLSYWVGHLGGMVEGQVGLVWSGGRLHPHDHKRSIPLSLWEPLLKVPGITFHALQIDIRESDLPYLETTRIVRHQDELKDFADTAALIAALDLVISVDTAVAHLAGALGKPVWILLCDLPDYRWMLGRDDSPWYPSCRLFRQARTGDWMAVIKEVTSALSVYSGFSRSKESLAPLSVTDWKLHAE